MSVLYLYHVDSGDQVVQLNKEAPLAELPTDPHLPLIPRETSPHLTPLLLNGCSIDPKIITRTEL